MDKVLKQRLVGASILIALAVIFLPMLFDSGEDDAVDQRELSLDMPERNAGDRRVRRLALDPDQARRAPGETRAEPDEDGSGESGRSRRERADEPEPRPEREAAPVEPAPEIAPETEVAPEAEQAEREDEQDAGSDDERPDAGADAEAESESEAESEAEAEAEAETSPEATEPPPEAPAAADDGRWFVQVAVFSNRETADSIRQRLDDLGHRARMDVLVRDQAELFRLRTGPYDAESVAGRARSQIAATVAGVDPVVRENPDETDGRARQGLAVQVGSFASRNNAERLVGQLDEAGYDAFMHEEESGGRTIWRVRVGTHDEREDAERLLEDLSEEQGLQGIVVSHP